MKKATGKVVRAVNAIKLSVPVTTALGDGAVEIGITVNGIPVDVLKTAMAGMKFRTAIVKALTEKITLCYEKGHEEEQTIADCLAEMTLTRARE